MTEWRKIPGIPHRFEVSDKGEVRTLSYTREVWGKAGKKFTRRYPERILKPRFTPHNRSTSDYNLRVTLHMGEGGCGSADHRVDLLVAKAFLGLPPGVYRVNGPGYKRWVVHHLDGDRRNCSLDNLEWQRLTGGYHADEYRRNRADFEKLDPATYLSRLYEAV